MIADRRSDKRSRQPPENCNNRGRIAYSCLQCTIRMIIHNLRAGL